MAYWMVVRSVYSCIVTLGVNVRICRQVRVRWLHGDRDSAQCRGMMNFSELASAASDLPEPFTDRLRLAVAAYLARFKGSSREHTESDLRCYLSWCAERGLDPLAAQRPHLELYIRWMQEIRRFKPSTVSRRFSVTAGFYRTCVLDGLLQHSPAEHVRRPAVPAESPTLGFTHLQFEALLTAARESPNPSGFALVAMLGLLGLRIFEATGAAIANLGEEHGHRVLRVCGKGSKVVQVPLPPAVSRAIDRAAGLRDGGPILLNRRGTRMDRHAATRRLRHLADTAGLRAKVHPHMLRHTFVTTMQGRGVASDATFREKREHPRPGLQLPRPSQRAGRVREQSGDDLRCQHPVASNETMLQLLLLHPVIRMMQQMQQKAQRRGGMPLPPARQAEVFGRVGKPLPTSFDAGVDLRDVQIAARHADPRTTMRYDRARTNLDRHPNYILAAYMSSAT
jgi:integrase/recombinase XerD